MTIKVTLNDAIGLEAAINKLPSLPAKAAYKFARIADVLRRELKELEVYRRMGGNEPERREEANAGMARYLSKEITLDFEPIDISEIAINGIEVLPHVLATLSRLISDGGKND